MIGSIPKTKVQKIYRSVGSVGASNSRSQTHGIWVIHRTSRWFTVRSVFNIAFTCDTTLGSQPCWDEFKSEGTQKESLEGKFWWTDMLQLWLPMVGELWKSPNKHFDFQSAIPLKTETVRSLETFWFVFLSLHCLAEKNAGNPIAVCV